MSASPSDLAVGFQVCLPDWLAASLAQLPSEFVCVEDRMRLVLSLARRNVEEQTGGPFAACVFERDSGRLVSVGVNRVEASRLSSAHAEVVCLSLAQRALQSYDLSQGGIVRQLVVNWRPCAMCFGAVLWSGVADLVIAGDGPELERITGFDEGPVVETWRQELEKRGIALTMDVLRKEAVEGFYAFAKSGNAVYNARQG
ncbi:Guanine deaminase [Porphyridium purpureum]|uniref:Guanine deaminase n=1 Tax=Porphyridium purpureum TaxID=35688 RepID=A0A5J4YJ14_PORPP|nr:Guanine deaminase [Porphyridium purpureum]|eukprot:POR3820..scf297_16